MTSVTVNSNARQIKYVSVGLPVSYVLLNVMIAYVAKKK